MKKAKDTIDFTKGSIPRHLLNFSLPLFLGNLLQTLYNTVDTIWVGKFLGSNALAAVSVSFPIIFILVSLVTGITMATTVLIGQYKGADDEKMIKNTVDNSLLLLTVASVIITIVGITFHRSILKLMNTPDELMDLASGYLNIIFIGLIFSFGYNSLGAVLRGLGDSKTPLRYLFYTTVMNIVLDPILIFGLGPFPRMGINGAALATIISQAVSFFLEVRYLNKSSHLFKISLKGIKIHKKLIKKILQIGLPAGLQQTVVALGATVVMSLVNSFGASTVAAYGAATKIDSFSFMPSMSVGLATSALAAQNIGAGKYKRVNETMKWASIMSIAISIFMMILVFVFPRQLLMLFTDEKIVLDKGVEILKILGISYIPFGLMWVSNGIIRGAGDTIVTMFISMFTLWFVRLPLAYFLSKYTTLASSGIWTAMTISSTLSGITSMAYYRSGRWKDSILLRPESRQ